MGKKYVAALDAGTSSNRCIIFDNEGKEAASCSMKFAQIYPEPGWVEHDALELWDTMKTVLDKAVEKSGLSCDDISGIGITNQRETFVLWDRKTGRPVYNAIVWQCKRTADYCRALISDGYEDMFREKTGLPIDPYFSATKLHWLLYDSGLDILDRARSGELLFGTVDTWFIWNLTGGKVHVTDYSNASRTLMFNICTLDWDDEILDILGIPRCILPEVKPSSYEYGRTDEGIPVCAAIGDQQSALFGHLCTEPGDAKNTYGTGCFLLMNTGDEIAVSKNGLISTVAWGLDGKVKYALEGSAFVAGAVLGWLRDGLGIISCSKEADEAAESVEDTQGVYFVPALAGLGAPYWRSDARGVITGITRGTRREHILRAALEGIAYETYDLADAMQKDSGKKFTSLHVDGGVSNSDFLLQMQADLLQAGIIRPADVEATALGAAYMAGLACGVWESTDDIRSCISGAGDVCFEPQMTSEDVEPLIRGWHEVVERA